jgi:DNA helicase-2/ATP-dependent DNA helicase PcrA
MGWGRNWMAEFTPSDEQAAILAHAPDEPACVLAGPGTGKSATLVAWLDQLLSTDNPPKVKLLTFTRAATAELSGKVLDHAALAAEKPSTIHSFAVSILLQNAGAGDFPQPLRMVDDWEKNQIVEQSLARRAKVNKRRIGRLIGEMAAAWESLNEEEDPEVDPEERVRFLGVWNEHRTVYGYTLPAELPFALLTALEEHPDLDGIDFDLLLVDEYQDLNACDLALIQAISSRGCAVIGAGDDDQSIYSFRKADPAGIRRFATDYSDAATYPLSISRRCGRQILEWATYVIEGDVDRPNKPRLTCPNEASEGEVALLSFAGQRAEATGIADLAKQLIDHDELTPQDILILLRGDYNGQFSAPIKNALAERDIPYSDPDALKLLLADATNRRVLESMRLAAGPEDSIAWASLLHLEDGVSASFIDGVYDEARSNGTLFSRALFTLRNAGFPDLPSPSANKAETLITNMTAWLDSLEVPPQTPEGGWGHWIVESSGELVVPTPSDELIELLAELDALVDTSQDLGRFLGQITPLGKDLATAKAEGVRVMSMASSKGLTVGATIIAGVESDIIPRPLAPIDEERRLLYVAMTRATDYLFVTWSRIRRGPTARSGKGKANTRRHHSRFLDSGPVKSQDGGNYLANR